MSRNRFLSNLVALIVSLAITYPIVHFIDNITRGGTISVNAGAFLFGGFILGLLAYKNDGIKIAAVISITVFILATIVGVMMIAGGGGAIVDFSKNVVEQIFGSVLGLTFIIIGIVLIAGFAISAGLFIVASAIGSAIGNNIWRDKEKELEARGAYSPDAYQPAQQPYQQPQPYQPAQQPAKQPYQQPQQARVKVCQYCGNEVPSSDSFCINCGAKF